MMIAANLCHAQLDHRPLWHCQKEQEVNSAWDKTLHVIICAAIKDSSAILTVKITFLAGFWWSLMEYKTGAHM